VAGNILNKELQSTSCGLPAWGFGAGLTVPHSKMNTLLRNVTHGLGLSQYMAQDGDQLRALVKTVMNLLFQ
jgi:hypothetical protein